MKKYLLVFALASLSVTGMAQAQDETPELKYSVATNSFWSNWFISADLDYSAFYSFQEKGAGLAKSPFKDFRRNLGFSVALGKWFTPGMGLRTKFTGMWGRYVQGTNASDNAIKYWNLQEQALFNLSNMLCGYNETRVWNFIPYAGAGIVRNMDYCNYSVAGSVGILNTWRLSKHIALNLDLSFNMADDDLRGNSYSAGNYANDGISTYDRWFSAEVGLTFNLGKATWNKVPDVDAIKNLSQSQIEALNAQLIQEQQENSNLQRMLNEERRKNSQPATNAQTVTVEKMVGAPVSVFFNIGKSKIASRKDLVNVNGIAQNAKENNSKIVVTGYADSKTGSASYNQKLSEKRAQTVADELVKMGVNRNNIEVVAAGGVNTLSPISYNRRATVEIK